MKTYTRKNSSYLKKAFIASNFNEMCRLCLSELDLGLTPIFQDLKKIGYNSYQEWIQYSVDVLIEEGDGLPQNICEECLAMVEQTYLFKKKCRASDSKLREHLALLELNKKGKLNEIGLTDLTEDHENLFRREEPREDRCDESSAIDSGGTNTELEKKSQQAKGISEEKLTTDIETQSSSPDDVFSIEEPQEKEKVVINQIKRYILKGEKRADDQEEDLTVCEVVPLDVRNEELVSSDVSEPRIYTTLENAKHNVNSRDIRNPQKIKFREIYQLWDNEDEGEAEQEVRKNEEKITISDMSWADNLDKSKKTQKTELLEEDVEQNGVLQVHRVYTNKNQSEVTEEKSETEATEARLAMETSETRLEIKTVTTLEMADFKCFACGKSFLTGVELKAHLTKFHREVSDAAFCEVCGKSFVCGTNLKRHMSIHTGYKPHKCKICGRTFSQGSILKRHIFTHETLKPFSCQICGKGYTQKMNLLSHFKSHGFRTEGETFNCRYCDKSFVHQSGLSRHLKLHKGVRFCCEHCKKTFVDSSALTRHTRTIHPKKM